MGRAKVILLDTHVVLWLAFAPERVSKKAQSEIEHARTTGAGLAISDISLLEMATLHRKGRIALSVTLETFLTDVEARFIVLPITGRICVRSLSLPTVYPDDPADRIIGATALVEALPLLSADAEIRRSKAVPTIW